MNDNQIEPEIQPEIPQPFAGRRDVFAYIRQYLVDPADRHALLIIGRDGMGKSQILKQCAHVFDDSVITCYIPLTDVAFSNDDAWLNYLIEQTNIALAQSAFTISRLPEVDDAADTYRSWFTETYLQEVNKLIRSHRRLVWLMDDVEYLLDAIATGKLPDDTLLFLYEMLQANLQLGIVLTLNEDNEAQTSQLAPLVSATLFQRLHPLSLEDTARLLQRFGLTIEDEAINRVYKYSDGHPLIAEYFGEALRAIRQETITLPQVDTVARDIYKQCQNTYRHIWQTSLSQNERLVLTAISGLLYDDPISKLNAQRIESWLLETDYPLDMTAVNAGIRGLEYRDLIIGSVDNISIRGELFQRWLIEHARMDEVNPAIAKSNATDEGLSLSRNNLLVIAGIAIAVILMVALLQQSNQATPPSLQPTVTLEQ